VSEKHRMDEANPLAKELDPQFRGCVDEQVSARKAEDDRAPSPLILGILACAGGAAAPDHGNAVRRASAEKDELSGDAFVMGDFQAGHQCW
jgi:hypothetical protein